MFFFCCKLICVGVMLTHLFICPYTKVEESFNLQAIHDWLFIGPNHLERYDHVKFPGVVPRSFIGAVTVASFSIPFVRSLQLFSKHIDQYPKAASDSSDELSKETNAANVQHQFGYERIQWHRFYAQIAVRAVLGLFVCYAFFQYLDAVSQVFNGQVAVWTLLITMTQFHFLFYASRTLPNTFALFLTLLACRHWLLENHTRFISLAAVSAIVFRSELVLLYGPILLMLLWNRSLRLFPAISVSFVAGILSMCWTVTLDSLFWNRPLWPEGEVLWYNTVLNKSSNWGTQPFYWYFLSALPRAMGFSYLFVPVALFVSPKAAKLIAPALLFIFAYSFLPHKEVRFIFYTIPLLNTASAVVCKRWCSDELRALRDRVLETRLQQPTPDDHLRNGCNGNGQPANSNSNSVQSKPNITERKKPSTWLAIFRYIVAHQHLFGNILLTTVFVNASAYNYPGGEALVRLHQLEVGAEQPVSIHMGNLAAQTGVTRFLEMNSAWKYSKTEDLTMEQRLEFTHLLAEVHSYETLNNYSNTHQVLEVIDGFERISLSWTRFPPFAIVRKPAIALLRRKPDLTVAYAQGKTLSNAQAM